jgi:hypothetical protein
MILLKVMTDIRVLICTGENTDECKGDSDIWLQDLVPVSGEEGGNNTEESLLNRQG